MKISILPLRTGLLLVATGTLASADPEADSTTQVIDRVMAIADQDNDGHLSLEEFKHLDVQARHHGDEHFQRGDVNKDGFLDKKELATELAAKQTWFVILVEGVEPCFNRLDTDQNQKLDPSEYRKISRMGGHAEHHHRGADDNEDGFLDLEEFTTHANAKLESAAISANKERGRR
jgi:Ca2+-binding EF-hand superfamily protein